MNAPVEPDELEDSRAPLLDHLIELRRRLLLSLAALLVAFVVCLVFAEPIFGFLVRPPDLAQHGLRPLDEGLANGREHHAPGLTLEQR